jgi:hypothetical protein
VIWWIVRVLEPFSLVAGKEVVNHHLILSPSLSIVVQYRSLSCANCDLDIPLSHCRYLVVAVLHFPCYALFALVLRLKHSLLGSWFPHTYVEN